MEKLKKDMHNISKVMFLLLILQAFITMQAVRNLGATLFAEVPFALELLPVTTMIFIVSSFLDIVVLAILGIKGFLEAASPSRSRWHIMIAGLSCALFCLSFIGSFSLLFSTDDLLQGICTTLVQGFFATSIALYIRRARSLRASAISASLSAC